MLKTLQRYVLREVLTPALMALGVLTFLLIARTVFSKSDDLAGLIPFKASLQLLLNLFPTLLGLTIPIALLIGALLGIGRLTVDSEIKAMRAHGVNLFYTFVPVLLLGPLLSLLMLGNCLYFAPWVMNRNLRMIDTLIIESLNNLEPGRFRSLSTAEGQSGVLYFKEKDPQTGRMKNVYLCLEGNSNALLSDKTEEPEDTPTSSTASDAVTSLTALGADWTTSMSLVDIEVNTLFLAASGEIKTDQALGLASLVLSSGTIHLVQDRFDTGYVLLDFKEIRQRINIRPDKDLSSENIGTQLFGMTFTDINNTIAEFKTSPDIQLYEEKLDEYQRLDAAVRRKTKAPKPPRVLRDIWYMRTEQFKRIAISLASLSFILIAVPLAIYIRPSGKSVGVSVAFGLIMVFYGFLYFGDHQAREGAMLGLGVILLPVFLLSTIGGVLLHRVVHR